MQNRGYKKVYTLNEAIAEYRQENTCLLAGGTDMLVKAHERERYAEQTILDISELRDCRQITDGETSVEIGAAVTLTEVLRSGVVAKRIPLLGAAVEKLANCQVRNRATLIGNLANGCPAADAIPALMALRATVHVVSVHGERSLPLKDLYCSTPACLRHRGMHVKTCYFANPCEKKLTLAAGEIIASVTIPSQKEQEKWQFYKLTQNRSSALAILNMAARMRTEAGIITEFSLCVGGVFPRPDCLEQYSGEVIGQMPSEALFEAYALQIQKEVEKEENMLADYEYKHRVLPALIVDVCKNMMGENG